MIDIKSIFRQAEQAPNNHQRYEDWLEKWILKFGELPKTSDRTDALLITLACVLVIAVGAWT